METVKFRFEAYADETPVRGNTHCIGDDDFINGVEEGILDELADGNIWAWASIQVTACIDGVEYRSYRDRCRYDNEADFLASQCYLNMKAEALSWIRDDLGGRLQAVNSAEHALAEECRIHMAPGGPTDSEGRTEVVFLRENNSDDIFAAFPDIEERNASIGSYAHVGQHSAASLAYCADCVEVTDPGDYADLAGELFRIGYKLRVVSKDCITGPCCSDQDYNPDCPGCERCND